jgi:hypothetical protein
VVEDVDKSIGEKMVYEEFLEAPEATTSSTSSETISSSEASDPAALSTMSSEVETSYQQESLGKEVPLATNYAPGKFTDPVPPTAPKL